jgi:U3 small nucleolar RNA-associated protein MPP10
MLALFEAIKSGNRHGFLQPTTSVSDASLQLAKSTLDAYAGQISDEQQQRLREANKKRKRANGESGKADVLKIRKLHVDGFESGQVWQQARRIISSALQDSKDALRELEQSNQLETNGGDGDAKTLEFDEDGFEVDTDDEEDEDEDEEESIEDVSGLVDDEAEEDDMSSLEEDEEVGIEEDDEGLEEELAEDGDDFDDEEEDEDAEESSEEFVPDPNGLNDGFFSIDEFNKQSQFFENQDAKADPNTDVASDDEEINWHSNPLAENPATNGKPSKKAKGDAEDEPLSDDDEDDDDEEGGPTFGNMDLDAPEGESDLEDEGVDEDLDGDMDDFNANDILYKDFFAPPAKKGNKNGKPLKPREPRTTKPDDTDVERAMADVRRDLFDDESEHEDSEDALSDVSAGDPRSRRSAHERRQAKLAEEIRKLESANVAEKKWALAGEAKAADRPKHSLLDENLDFEHVGKPVPVITTEVSESIEEMIKRRILAQEFDEVVRRRPDSDSSSNTRRGLVELDDSKAKQSLAEMYEEEHVKDTNPDTYVSKADEKLRKEEKEVEQMWKDVSAKLDALSSWHYKPKPTAPSLTVVADVATVSMEDAQPATAQGVSGGDHTLAPQEIYKAGKDTAEKGEVVAKSGLPVARQELSREEKTRRRRRQKERIRKAGGIDGQKTLTGKAQAQKDAMGDLKKGGVKVINKKGEVLDMEGNKAKAIKAASSGSFKL